jgi:hypothetical protein
MSAAVAELSHVHFDPPISFQVGPATAAGRKNAYLYTEITEIVRKLRVAGWDHRAIVVERKLYPSGFLATFDMVKPQNWGVVQQLNQTAPSDRDYRPLRVIWFEDGTISEHWPEDLFLVHESETQTDLEDQFKAELSSDPPV